MIRGKIKFKCHDCGCIFESFDVEYQATIFSQPMPCPKCSSCHTMPKSLFNFFNRGVYKMIWEKMENN